MSQTEDFFSRWSRLKSASGAGEGGVEEKADAPPAAEISSSAALDPPSLPPIESIVADSDIRPFLEPLVPAELMRAALRRAWNTDPTIRDFVGIADNQWDFNDQTAIPGFGPLEASDGARNAAVRALGIPSSADESLEESRIVEQPESMGTHPQYSDRGDEVSRVPTAPAHGSHDAHPGGESGDVTDAAPVAQSDAAEENPIPRPRRSHGGALPR